MLPGWRLFVRDNKSGSDSGSPRATSCSAVPDSIEMKVKGNSSYYLYEAERLEVASCLVQSQGCDAVSMVIRIDAPTFVSNVRMPLTSDKATQTSHHDKTRIVQRAKIDVACT